MQSSVRTKVLNREADKYLKERQIERGSTLMAAKKSPGTAGTQPVNVKTNVYALEQHKAVTVFRYEVKIEGIISRQGNEQVVIDLTEQTRYDFLNADRRCICRDVFKAYEGRIKEKLEKAKNKLYYDLSRILYALKDLKIATESCDCFSKEEIVAVTGNANYKHLPRYSLTIVPVSAGDSPLTLGDCAAHLLNDVGQMNTSLVQFLNIATAQNVLFNDPQNFMHYSASSIYLMRPTNFGFIEEDSPYYRTNSSFLGIGMDKSVRIVEDSQKPGGAKAALVVQVKKTPFHLEESVLSKVKSMFPRWEGRTWSNDQLAEASRMLKGLFVQTTYPEGDPQKQQRFPIWAFSATNAKTELLENADVNRITVEQYYDIRHGIKLTQPSAPLVIRRERGKSAHYPMEVLMVCDYQRVRSSQLTPEIHEEIIKKCAVGPATLRQQTDQLKKALNLCKNGNENNENNNNGYLKRLSVKCADNPMEVGARVLSSRDIRYFDNAYRPNEGGRWRAGKYLLPATIDSWCAIALVDNSRDNNVSLAGWKEFVDRYCETMRRKGIRFSTPATVEVFTNGNYDVRKMFDHLLSSGVGFVLVGHPKGHSGDIIHHTMKYHELHTEVISQGVLISTVLKTAKRSSTETFENIVNKTNIKMGGLNYALPFSNGMFDDTLVIGFAINHPAGGFGMVSESNNGSNGGSGAGSEVSSENGSGSNGSPKQPPKLRVEKGPPSVVGYSANIGASHCSEFVGDYKYQEARCDEKLLLVDHIVCRCLDAYKKRGDKDPSSVVIYRNACGEGFYQHLLTYEVPLIKRLLSDRCKAKLTMIVVNKLQNIRFTPSKINAASKAADQNVRPGTVIDKGVVSPQWSEFFLASQRALQGTARVPRYTILVDENNYSMDNIQEFTFGLCFGHQIVTSPISLPAPVYIALEYAKRGRNNYNADQLTSARAQNWDSFDGPDGPNENFCFEKKYYLSKWRVNA